MNDKKEKKSKALDLGNAKAFDVMDEKEFHKIVKECSIYTDQGSIRMIIDSLEQAIHHKNVMENRLRAHQQGTDRTNATLLQYMVKDARRKVSQMQKAVESWAHAHPLARYMMQFNNIAAVGAAKLICLLDLENLAPTVGHWWNYAGLNPQIKWLGAEFTTKWMRGEGLAPKGTKEIDEKVANTAFREFSKISGVKFENYVKMHTRIRRWDAKAKKELPKPRKITGTTIYQTLSRRPWNRTLGVYVHQITDSMFKAKGRNGGDYFGKIFQARQEMERNRNERGDNAEAAAGVLKRQPNHAQRKIYEQGRLPDGHVNGRVLRWCKKFVLSTLHTAAWVWLNDSEPPQPFAVAHMGHAHVLRPDTTEELREFFAQVESELKEEYGVDALPSAKERARKSDVVIDAVDDEKAEAEFLGLLDQ